MVSDVFGKTCRGGSRCLIRSVECHSAAEIGDITTEYEKIGCTDNVIMRKTDAIQMDVPDRDEPHWNPSVSGVKSCTGKG